MQISQHLPKIINLISSYPTVSVVAPTGSGKSVGIPAAIASVGARCYVVVPTRTAAVSLYEYQKILQLKTNSDMGRNINELVGYAAEGNINYGTKTIIAYITGGHARKKMLGFFTKGKVNPINFCDVLMVDEVHSGSIDTTVIISLWMKAAESGVTVPRLVVVSATPIPMIIEPKPVVYKVELATYPIEYKYLPMDIDIDDPDGGLYYEAAQIAYDLHKKNPIDNGHILIFAPGSSEVENIHGSMKELMVPLGGKNPKIATVIPAYGSLKKEDIAMIYKATEPNERKIIIATNIAEMSITISDVGFVIDTMVEKRAETSQSGGFRLTTHYISKDSAKQRAGRTGRTRDGICYRLCTKETYEQLEEHRPPEIERVPIYDTIMELLAVGLQPETVIKGMDIKRLIQATKLLINIGMVTNNGTNIIVTDMGHFAPKFNLSVRNAAFLWYWIKNGYPIFPGLVVAALIDSYGPSYFWIPKKKSNMTFNDYDITLKQYKEKFFSKYLGYNDLETCINMWSDLMSNIGDITASQRVINNWSRENSINNKKIKELLNIIDQSIRTLNKEGVSVTTGPFTTQGVLTAAKPILLSIYSDHLLIHKRDITYYNTTTTGVTEEYRLDNRDAVNQFLNNPPIGIISLVTAEIKTQRGVFRIISLGLDTSKDSNGLPILSKPLTSRGTVISRHKSVFS